MVGLLVFVNLTVLVLFFLQKSTPPDPDIYKRIAESKAQKALKKIAAQPWQQNPDEQAWL